MHHGIDRSQASIRMVPMTGVTAGHVPGAALETLERRLLDGYDRIEQARSRGEDVAAWEEFWVELLHQYEDVHDTFPDAA